MRTRLISLMVVLAVSTLSQARAAFNPAAVPATAKWVLYMDLVAFRSNPMGRALVNRFRVQAARSNPGGAKFDLATLADQAHELTAYGTSLPGTAITTDAVVVARGGKAFIRVTKASLAKEEKATAVSDLPFPAFALADGSTEPPLIVGFPDEVHILVSRSIPQLRNVAAVGHALPSLSQADSGFLLQGFASPNQESFVFASVILPKTQEPGEPGLSSSIFQLAQKITFSIGEQGDLTRAHADLVAADPEQAQKLAEILHGLNAMETVGGQKDSTVAAVVSAITITQANATVTLDLAYPSTQIAQWLLPETPDAKAAALAARGPVVDTWRSDEVKALDERKKNNRSFHTVGPISLEAGSVITIVGVNKAGTGTFGRFQFHPAENPQVDLGELNIGAAKVKGSAGGQVGRISDADSAPVVRIVYPGPRGLFTLTVRYHAPDPADPITFTVRLAPPAPNAAKP